MYSSVWYLSVRLNICLVFSVFTSRSISYTVTITLYFIIYYMYVFAQYVNIINLIQTLICSVQFNLSVSGHFQWHILKRSSRAVAIKHLLVSRHSEKKNASETELPIWFSLNTFLLTKLTLYRHQIK